MKNTLTLNERRMIKSLVLESEGLLTEGSMSKIIQYIKNKINPEKAEEIKQDLNQNLNVDENSSKEEIEEKLMEKTNGDPNLLTSFLKESLGFGTFVIFERLQSILAASLVIYSDFNPIVIAATIIYTIFRVTDTYEKIRRKVLGPKIDKFIHGKRTHLGDYGDEKKMNENKKKVIRLTESDLMRLVKRVIKENKKQKLNEGIGTVLLVLTGAGIFYLGRKLKKFIDKYGKLTTTFRLGAFLGKLKAIEDGKEDGKIVVKESGNRRILAAVIDGKVFDSITIDLETDEIYSGHKKELNRGDKIFPMELPFDADTKDIDEIRVGEELLIDEILEIIAKYGKPIESPESTD